MEKFINYCLEHGKWSVSTDRVRSVLTELIKNVSFETIDFIVEKSKVIGARYTESKSGIFAPAFKEVRFPLRSDSAMIAFHEIGHMVDFIGIDKQKQIEHSKRDILANGKTLHKTIYDEMKTASYKIYEIVNSAFENEVLARLDDHVKDSYLQYRYFKLLENDTYVKYKFIKSKSPDEANRIFEEYQAMVRQSDSMKELKKVFDGVNKSADYIQFRNKYSTLIDTAFSYLNKRGYYGGHTFSYMEKGGYGAEFFAEMFCKEALGDTEAQELVRKYLPNSYSVYKELICKIKAT